MNTQQMPPLTHCPECGIRTARLVIRGELQSLYECRCGHAFERDHPANETTTAFSTRARCLLGRQGALFPMQEHPS